MSQPPVASPPEETSAPATRSSRSWRWGLLALLLVAALGFLKWHYFPPPKPDAKGGKGAPGKGGAGKGGGPAVVEVVVVQPTPLADEVTTTGSVLADEAVVIKSEISGKITQFNIREGQPVRQGQVLFSINAAELQASLRKQEYNLRLFRDQAQRQQTLLAKDYISAQEFEQANNQVLTAQAEVEALRANLAKAYVRAPFAGVLGLTTATVGTYVSPGTEITTLSRTQPVKIDFSVPGRYAAQVRVGDQVTVTDEATTRQFQAQVYALDPQIDPVSRTQPVRARYANRRDELRPGAFVKVKLALSEAAATLQVPTEAVIPEAGGYSVFTVKAGKAVATKVKIGVRSEKVIQITEGLAAGDSVIRTGILQLKPGDAVKVQPATAAAR